MLAQLTLRFPKKLIERLKNRATTENTSVNALAERLMESSLQTSAAGEEYLRLTTDPDEALRQLYRQLILGQNFGASAPTRDTLQFLLELAHQGYNRGQGQLVNRRRLQVLLDITLTLLSWQVENHQPVDVHYLKGTFGLTSENWQAEWPDFLARLTPVVTQDYAGHLLRPLASRALNLNTFPDEVLSGIFTTQRLKEIFPLCMYARNQDFDSRRRFMEQVRPPILAAKETFSAGPLKFEIHITGQEPGTRPGGWYETPRLCLFLTGENFAMTFGWAEFSELLRVMSVYHHHPEILPQGWQGYHAMFMPRATSGQDVMIGLDALRVYLPEDGFVALASEFVGHCEHGQLHQTLESLRCIYGDL